MSYATLVCVCLQPTRCAAAAAAAVSYTTTF